MRAKVGCDGDLVAGVLAADAPAVSELLRRLYTAYCLQRMQGAALRSPPPARAGRAPMTAPCVRGSAPGAESRASEPGVAGAWAPHVRRAELQVLGPGGVGSGAAAPGLAPGVDHAGAEMHASLLAPGVPAWAEPGSPGSASAGLETPRTSKSELEPQAGSLGLQHSLPEADGVLETRTPVREPYAMPHVSGLGARTPQLSCSTARHPPVSGCAGFRSSLALGTRLSAEERSGAAALAAPRARQRSAEAGPMPFGTMVGDCTLRDEAGGPADTGAGLAALDAAVLKPPDMRALASTAAAQQPHERQDMVKDGSSPASSPSGVWHADARAVAPWPRCSLRASFEGSAGVPEPVTCNSPRLRSPAASWGRSPRARRALFLGPVAPVESASGAGQASWGFAGPHCSELGADVPPAASGLVPHVHRTLFRDSGVPDSGAAAGVSDEAGQASRTGAELPRCKSPGLRNLGAASTGCISRARRALFAEAAASPSRPEVYGTHDTGGSGDPGQSAASGAASKEAMPCTQGFGEAHVSARPAAVPCQRYPCEEAGLPSPEPAWSLPQAPAPAQRSSPASCTMPSDAWANGSGGNAGALCKAAEAAHALGCGLGKGAPYAMMARRQPLRTLCSTGRARLAAAAPRAHRGATSCPARGSASGAAMRACAKVCLMHMTAGLHHCQRHSK